MVTEPFAEARAGAETLRSLRNSSIKSPLRTTWWALIHPRERTNSYDFVPADAFVNFGLSNKMYLVGHTLVWHSQTPNWVFAGTNPPPTNVTANVAANTNAPGTNQVRRGGFGGGFGRYNGPRASREELLQRMRDHIHTMIGHYNGKSWDVVNEAIADGPRLNGTHFGQISGRTSSPRRLNTRTKRTRMRSSVTTTTDWRTRKNAASSSR
jgi:GH35 family endo-1,4-beta-xylanase